METEGKPPTAVEDSIEFLTEFDLHLFNEGTHYRLYDKLGAHPTRENGVDGVHFALWAPNAQRVYVLGDFNDWEAGAHPLSQRGHSGVWAGFIPQVQSGTAYLYRIVSWHHSYQVDKTDPFGFRHEGPPRFASFVWDLGYDWRDQSWMERRATRNIEESPLSIYELHLESWMRVPEQGNRWLTFREAAPKLLDYVRSTGFTHVQFMPIMEHPGAGPRDYDIIGYFAPANRYGTPQDFMYLVDLLHQNGIGVLLDWVPSHFPADDEHGLAYFDGTHLFESSVRILKSGPAGKGLAFDLERREVRSFLTSAAFYWMDRYHVDGLKVDSASAILHLDYGRPVREYVSNVYGGRENLDGIAFLRTLNSEVQRSFPGAITIVEEQTGWPNTTSLPHNNGLGFTFKWDESFANRTLQYLRLDPLFRKHDHALVSDRGDKSFEERLLLPLGHASVGDGQGSLLSRMAGDEWQRFANLRLLLAYQYLLPGKKLMFMGTELAQWQDWTRDGSLDWHLLAYPSHNGVHRWVGDLNHLYRSESALHQSDTSPVGFEWVDRGDAERSALSWLRRDTQRREVLLVALNFTPLVRHNFQLGVRRAGHWKEVLNGDARIYGGSGQGNLGGVNTAPFSSHGFSHMVTLTLPPLSAVVFKHQT